MRRRRKPFHHGDLRRAVLEASLAILETEGVGALSLRRVASELGVTHAAPYHHFRDKTELMKVIAMDGFRVLGGEMKKAYEDAGDDPMARLAAAGRAYIRFALTHRAHFAVMFRPEVTSQRAKSSSASAAEEAFQLLRLGVTQVLGAGLAPATDPRLPLLVCWAVAHGLAELWLNGPIQTMEELGGIDAEMLFSAMDLLPAALQRVAPGRPVAAPSP